MLRIESFGLRISFSVLGFGARFGTFVWSAGPRMGGAK